MAFGVIHLFTGLGIKGYMLLKDKKVLDFFCDVVLWYVFLIGLLLMLLPSEIFASIAQIDPSIFPPAVSGTGKVLAIVAVSYTHLLFHHTNCKGQKVWGNKL